MHAGVFLLAYSRKLAENLGICLKMRAPFPEWGRPWGMSAVVPAVYGKFPLLLNGQMGYAESNSRITSRAAKFIWLAMWASR